MFRTRVIPCLLLKGKGLVKTVRFSDPTYVGDPINAVKIFNDAKADELIFLDITATNEKRLPAPEVIKDIAEEAYMPFAVGGGIRTLEDAARLINAGAEKVVLNTAAVENMSLLTETAARLGSQSIIGCIDVRKKGDAHYTVFTHSGKKDTGKSPYEVAKQMENAGAGEIMINSIDRDGTYEGYDIKLVKAVCQTVSVPVIACGGAGKSEDLRDVIDKAGASASAAGSLFVFAGKKRAVLINYPDKQEMEEIFK